MNMWRCWVHSFVLRVCVCLVCHKPPSYVWQTCAMTRQQLYASGLCVSQPSLIFLTRSIHTCDMTREQGAHKLYTSVRVKNSTHVSCVVPQDSFICVTRSIHTCDMTREQLCTSKCARPRLFISVLCVSQPSLMCLYTSKCARLERFTSVPANNSTQVSCLYGFQCAMHAFTMSQTRHTFFLSFLLSFFRSFFHDSRWVRQCALSFFLAVPFCFVLFPALSSVLSFFLRSFFQQARHNTRHRGEMGRLQSVGSIQL